MPVAVQWLLSVVLLAGMVVWIIVGNTATGSIGTDDCELDSWLVPVAGGVIAYITAYGFFGTPIVDVIKGMVPLILTGGFAALFAWRGALLPYVIGCSSTSFMLILVVFNSGVTVDGPGGKAIVDYDFAKYRNYVAVLLTMANGVINAFGWLMEHDFEWVSSDVRWAIATFLSPVVLLLPALIAMAKGDPNGQYNVPDNATFVRLYIATRLGIYFCMYYFVHYQFETIIVGSEVCASGVCGNFSCDLPAVDEPAPCATDDSAGGSQAGWDDEIVVAEFTTAELLESTEARGAWIATAALALLCLVWHSLPQAIAGELCPSCCPFAAHRATDPKYDNDRKANLGRWCYWSAGLVIGCLLTACSLPEVLLRFRDVPPPGMTTAGFVLWWKLILGLGMIYMHCNMMQARTLFHNAKFLENGRGNPKTSDASWRKNKAICQVRIPKSLCSVASRPA